MQQGADRQNDRIKELFKSFDASGDGYLDISELETILKTIGTFNSHEIGIVCAAVDSSKDGKISLKEFFLWLKTSGGSKECVKAKALLSPSDDDGLIVVFYNFCGAGHAEMDGKAFLKLCKDCHLLDKHLTETAADLIFSNNKVKPKGLRSITYPQFEVALELLAERKGMKIDDVRDTVIESTRPVLQGTKAQDVRFHNDPKFITDAQRQKSQPHTEKQRQRSAATRKTLASKPPKPKGQAGGFFLTGIGEPQAPEGLPPDYSPDNRRLWRTFGIDSTAGRALKRLYSLPYLPEEHSDSPGPSSPSRRMRWPPVPDTYVAVNSLRAATEGLHFRRSMHLRDMCHGPDEYVPWGTHVQGERVDTCWLRVGERYLPVEVNSKPLLRRWDGPGPHPMVTGREPGHSTSLPALGSAAKPGAGMGALVGTSLVRAPDCPSTNAPLPK